MKQIGADMTEHMISRFIAARRRYIEAQFNQLNKMQREAVLTTEGPLLLLAGAGSGKTTVLINRIANLIRYGRASDSGDVPDTVTDEDVLFLESLVAPVSDLDRHRADYLCTVDPAAPWSVLAITFTNKAANELKERLITMLGDQAQDVWAMTFHAACCRILRRDIERLGYTRSFTIYDTADSERLMKEVIRDMGLDDKTFPAKTEALSDVLGFVDQMLDCFECPMKIQTAVCVAIEEVFVNVAHYAYGDGEGDMTLGIGYDEENRTITFRMSDRGVPFDPLKKPDPDITLSADEREIGGLGIFIAKKTMDSISYAYKNNENILTMIKKI